MDLNNNIQNAACEGATPQEPETQMEDFSGNASGTAPHGPTATEDDSARSGKDSANSAAEQQEKAPYLSFKYNHENTSLTFDEAVNAAQIGLKYGEISKKLDRAAAIKGVSAEELLDSIISTERDNYRASILEKLGEDSEEVEKLMKLYDIEQEDKYNETLKARHWAEKNNDEILNERLAAEFLELRSDFPEYSEYANLPADVRKAAENGKDLIAALLLHKHRENKKTAAAKETEAKATKATVGSLLGDGDSESSTSKDFLKGLWGM